MKRKSGEPAMSNLMQQSLNDVEQCGLGGLIVVPAKPTLEMLTRGASAGDITVEAAWRVWQAMTSAAEEEEA